MVVPQVATLTEPGEDNYGFDRQNGFYKGGRGDHIAYRYQIRDIVGAGSFGIAYRCTDHADGKVCVVKVQYTDSSCVESSCLEPKQKTHQVKIWVQHSCSRLIVG